MTPDLNETNRFLNILFGPDPSMCWQTFKNSPTCEAKPGWRYGSLSKVKDWLIESNQQGLGVYFVVNEGDGKGRSTINITKVRSLFLDLDGAPLQPVLDCPLQPAVITESSPGRYQAFWPVHDCPLEKFTGIQAALAERFQGDFAVCDLPRVMRLPGFYHLKNAPFQSKIHKVNTNSGQIGVRDLIAAAQLIPKPTKTAAPMPPDDQPINKGQRNRTMVTVAARLRNAGMSGQRLHEALMSENKARCVPALTDGEISKISKWANKKDAVIVPPARGDTTKNVFKEIKVMSWRELSQMNLPEPRWIIKDLLPQGLTILAGAPKVGKSWLVQHLCLAISEGGKALNHFDCNTGEVLSLALEDTPQRFKKRMQILNQGRVGPEGAYFANDWPTLPEGVYDLEEWLQNSTNPRLVIIDTLQKIRGRGGTAKMEGIYERDYNDVGLLQKLAGKFQVAIILVHHKRKAESQDTYDSVSGSVGITGAADSVWILERKDRAEMVGVLDISGRDISDRKYQLVWQEKFGLWTFQGTPQEYTARGNQQKILDAMKDIAKPTGPTDISSVIGVSKQAIQKQLGNLLSEGLVERAAGQANKYVLSPSWDAGGM